MKKQESFYWNNMKITPQEQSYTQKYMPNLQSKCLTLRIKILKNGIKLNLTLINIDGRKLRFVKSLNEVQIMLFFEYVQCYDLEKHCLNIYVLLRYMYIPNLQTYIPEILKEFKVLKLHLILSTCSLMVFG